MLFRDTHLAALLIFVNAVLLLSAFIAIAWVIVDYRREKKR